jgi:hypothetical protein
MASRGNRDTHCLYVYRVWHDWGPRVIAPGTSVETPTEEAVMTIHSRASIIINRQMEDVWSYLDDETHDPVWRRPYVKQVTSVATGPHRVGSIFEGVSRNGLYVTEVTVYEPPTRMSWRFVSYPAGPLKEREGSYLLSPEGQSARMTLEVVADTVGVVGAVLSLLAPILLRFINPRLLNQLKAAVEALAPTPA